MPTVSVIIPCFNHGRFLQDAVASVLAQSFTDFEIIIVNDGSTDVETNRLLHNYSEEKTQVIHTANMGLAAARNNGIAIAKGKYILPLDADDRIGPAYLEKAVAILEDDPQTGIVYCQARLFGAVDTEWLLPAYSLEKMLVDNIIFCSGFFRKTDWHTVGGFDTGMVHGWEDYEFWLSLIEMGRKVVKIEETLFYYRVASDSMVRSKEKWQKVAMFTRIYQRHQKLFSDHIGVWVETLVDARDTYYTSRLYVDCGGGISDLTSVGRKIEGGTRYIVFNLEGFSNIQTVRFDPVDIWAVVEISSVRAVCRSGEVIDIRAVESNALYSHQGRLLFDSCDPQCFFPELGPLVLKDVRQLIVELHFLALAEQALAYIVKYQRDELEAVTSGKLPSMLRQTGRFLLSTLTGGRKGS